MKMNSYFCWTSSYKLKKDKVLVINSDDEGNHYQSFPG